MNIKIRAIFAILLIVLSFGILSSSIFYIILGVVALIILVIGTFDVLQHNPDITLKEFFTE